MEGCWSNDMEEQIKDNCAAISVYCKEWAVRAVASPSPSTRVLISLFWTERIDCRGWASLDMSFKTPMPSRCSIFIHLQVSNRPSGQHIVSLPVSSAVDGTYVVDENNMKPPASHPAFSSPLSSSSLLLLFSFLQRSTEYISDNSYISVIANHAYLGLVPVNLLFMEFVSATFVW